MRLLARLNRLVSRTRKSLRVPIFLSRREYEACKETLDSTAIVFIEPPTPEDADYAVQGR